MSTTSLVGRSVLVRVPATTANLGPGFDTLGMALTIQDELRVTVTSGSEIVVDVHGVGEGEVPTNGENLIARSLAHAFLSNIDPLYKELLYWTLRLNNHVLSLLGYRFDFDLLLIIEW